MAEKVKNTLERQHQAMQNTAEASGEQTTGNLGILRQVMQDHVQRNQELLDKIEARISEVERGHGAANPPHQRVPLLPMLGFLTKIIASLLEVTV